MSKRPVQQQLFRALALSLIIALIGGGIALLSQWHQPTSSSHAASADSSDSVVGPPSLPAATVDAIFSRLGSPMTGTGQAVENASRAANIDDAFALAVWWTETNDGAAGVGRADRNPGSVRGSVGYPSAYDGYTIYPSYTAAVNYWFPMLQKVYINRGLTTVTAISHPYVGTSTSNLWAGKVIALMQRYRAEAPAPQPATPAPPTVSAHMQHIAQTVQQHGQAWSEPPLAVQQSQNTQANTQTSGLSGSTENLLVLINLLLALALGLWAWKLNRRVVSVPKPVIQPVGNVWEQLQASNQQPATFFRQQSLSGLPITESLTGSLPNTGQLVANASGNRMFAMNAPETGQLAFNTPRPGMFAAHALGADRFAASVPGIDRFAASTHNSGNFAAHASGNGRFGAQARDAGNFSEHTSNADRFAASVPGADRFAAYTPGADMYATHNPRQFASSGSGAYSSRNGFAANQPPQTPQPAYTNQLPFETTPAYTGQLPFEPATGQLPFEAAIAALSNQHPFNAPAYPQGALMPGSGLPNRAEQTYAPMPGSPYREFQPAQPAASYPWPPAEQQQPSIRQPQPVGAGNGRSNGLLSRYREMQAQGQR